MLENNSTPRARAWSFTLNNWTEDEYHNLINYESTYIIIGKETAPTTGTPHLQGYIRFKNAVRLTTLCAAFPKIHWEPAKGTPEQNITYCQKENNWEEHGERPSTTGHLAGIITNCLYDIKTYEDPILRSMHLLTTYSHGLDDWFYEITASATDEKYKEMYQSIAQLNNTIEDITTQLGELDIIGMESEDIEPETPLPARKKQKHNNSPISHTHSHPISMSVGELFRRAEIARRPTHQPIWPMFETIDE